MSNTQKSKTGDKDHKIKGLSLTIVSEMLVSCTEGLRKLPHFAIGRKQRKRHPEQTTALNGMRLIYGGSQSMVLDGKQCKRKIQREIHSGVFVQRQSGQDRQRVVRRWDYTNYRCLRYIWPPPGTNSRRKRVTVLKESLLETIL